MQYTQQDTKHYLSLHLILILLLYKFLKQRPIPLSNGGGQKFGLYPFP